MGLERIPKSVREARLAGDREALRRLGKMGAAKAQEKREAKKEEKLDLASAETESVEEIQRLRDMKITLEDINRARQANEHIIPPPSAYGD
jgi:hypothetical protein